VLCFFELLSIHQPRLKLCWVDLQERTENSVALAAASVHVKDVSVLTARCTLCQERG